MNTASMPKTLSLDLVTMNQYGIWTGGADSGTMKSVNATSILGGLRFWTEALMRAQGRYVCSKQGRCTHDKERQDKTCNACKVFGCTGISRAFSLQVGNLVGEINASKPTRATIFLREHVHEKNGVPQTPQYYLTTGYVGPFSLKLAARRPDMQSGNLELPGEVLTALLLMIEYGTMGASDQYGCGLAGFASPELAASLRKLAAQPLATGSTAADGVSLKDFFFFKGIVPSESLGNAMGEIRCIVRETFHQKKIDDKLRHWFCGSGVKDKDQKVEKDKKTNSGTKYVYSIDGKGRLYGWGHFARNGEWMKNAGYIAKREQVVDILHNTLRQKLGQSLVWKEFGAPSRDAVSPGKWPDYLMDMIRNGWRTLP